MLAGALQRLSGLRIHATDGDVGQLHDLYIEDRHWRVEYLHVDTRRWLFGRHVLLSPSTVQALDWDRGRIYVGLTSAQVAARPDLDSQEPDDRQWSARALARYSLEGQDGDLGRLEDLLVDLDRWTIRHVAVDPARAAVPVDAIESIDAEAKRIRIGLTREAVGRLPRVEDTERMAGTSR
jgi:hypothetical protein